MGGLLRVKNWDRFQSYGGRTPPWIKLHVNLLNNRAFMGLDLRLRALLMMLWVLASEADDRDGSVRADLDDLRFRLRDAELEWADIERLCSAGFLSKSSDFAPDLASPAPEKAPPKPKAPRAAQAEMPETDAPALALITAYNNTFDTKIGPTAGNVKAARRALDEKYTYDQIVAVFEAVRDKATPTAAWAADNNREFEYLLRPAYRNADKGLMQGPLDKVTNELATGRKAD